MEKTYMYVAIINVDIDLDALGDYGVDTLTYILAVEDSEKELKEDIAHFELGRWQKNLLEELQNDPAHYPNIHMDNITFKMSICRINQNLEPVLINQIRYCE